MQLNHAGHRTSSLRRSPGPIELMGCLANGSTLGRRALPPWHTGVAAGDRMRGALRRLLGGDTLRRLLGGDTLTQEVSLGPPPCNPFPPLASRGDELATVRLRTERVGRHRCVSTPIPRRRRREESPSRSRTTQIPEMEGREQAGATCCVTAPRTSSALAIFALAVYALRWLLWRFGGALADELPRTNPARAPDVTACSLAEMRDGDGVGGRERRGGWEIEPCPWVLLLPLCLALSAPHARAGWHPCDIHATSMQHPCNIHATSMQHPCNIHATSMQWRLRPYEIYRGFEPGPRSAFHSAEVLERV